MKNGRWYGVGGRQRIQVRDAYVRDVVAPLLRQSATGVVKLDLVLRGLASVENSNRGLVPKSLSWCRLHELCRGQDSHAGETELRRKWVSDKLDRLEALNLIERDRASKIRPGITVLSDRGDGSPLDRPGEGGDHYVTVLGELMEYDHLGHWGAGELAAYLAAMNAERLAHGDADLRDALELDDLPVGGGRWYRPLTWFADADNTYNRPPWQVRYPFSERTLRRGYRSLTRSGLIVPESIALDPRDGHRFPKGPRVLYHNGFDDLRFTDEYRRNRLRSRQEAATSRRHARQFGELAKTSPDERAERHG